MSLYRINAFIVSLLTLFVLLGFYDVRMTSRTYVSGEKVQHIKGDILEVGHYVVKYAERDGVDSTLDFLQKSLEIHREYTELSLVVDGKVVVSTEKTRLNKPFEKGIPIEELRADSIYDGVDFFIAFPYHDGELLLVVRLDNAFLKEREWEMVRLIDHYLFYFAGIMVALFIVLYYLTVRPLLRLNKGVVEQELEDKEFLISEYRSLKESFLKKYDEVRELNRTLEEKVIERTEALIRTNELFKEAQRLTHLGNWEWDTSGNIMVWSDEIYRIFGFRPQEFVATYDAFISMVHQDDRQMVREALQKALETGKGYHIRHRIILPDGLEKLVEERGEVAFSDKGAPIRMIGTIHNITASHRYEKDLQLQSHILNSFSDSIFVSRFDGSFIYVNEAACTARGYTHDEMMKIKLQDLDSHDEKLGKEIFLENMQKIREQMERRGEARFEVTHRTKDGRDIPQEIYSKIVHGEEGYVISIARDISERKEAQRRLEQSERQFRSLVENSQMGIFTTRIGGDVLYVNDTVVEITEFDSLEELYGHEVISVYKDPSQREAFIRELQEKGKVDGMEVDVLTHKNNLKTVLVSAHIEGETITGIMMDITAAKKARQEIEKLSKALEQIDDVVVITDRSGMIAYVNEAFSNHTGYTRSEALGKTSALLKSGKHDTAFYKNMWGEILSGRIYRGLVINRKKSGDIYYEEKTITPIKNRNGEIISFVSTSKDITDRVAMQQQLEKLASTDYLTGIFNRHKFEGLMKSEIERVERYDNPLSIVMFDIDYFKKVNDTYGHDKGDRILQNITSVVREHIRKSDIFARWGGEEFLILCPETESDNAAVLAEKLRSAIASLRIDEVGIVTSSFGVTAFDKGETKESFIKRVDDALYKAKSEGRNRVAVI